MQALAGSPLTGATAHVERTAIVEATRTWTWRQIHEAAIALSRRLHDAPGVCNVCTSRAGFLITCLATFRNRRLLILPPSASNADLAAVLQAVPGTVLVGDAEECIQPGLHAGVYLSCRPEWETRATTAELAWQPAWNDIAVLLYTSGSTGVPEAQPKTLLHLATGALVLGARLDKEVAGGVAAIDRIICSVPQQHMFGFECSVMLPLVYGMAVLDRRPLLAADVCSAFSGSPAGAWIATPMHLRNLVQAEQHVPSCRIVIASTMPLGQAVAQHCEALVQAPVLEIYGSTETGALATRRTAEEARWRPLADVQLDSRDGATVARGSHFASPVKLLDELILEDGGSFTLLGRQDDVVKIAGRRASLSGLNLLLQDLPGLEDGVLYLPGTGNPAERLCLIHTGPPLDRDAARRWLRARLDPVFLPRAFIRLERLPRNDNGKLRRQKLDQAYAEWQASRRAARVKDVAECS